MLAAVGRRSLRSQLKGWPSGICYFGYLVFGHQVFAIWPSGIQYLGYLLFGHQVFAILCIWYLATRYLIFGHQVFAIWPQGIQYFGYLFSIWPSGVLYLGYLACSTSPVKFYYSCGQDVVFSIFLGIFTS